LRGILANDYGVDLNAIDWVTFEDAHVAEFEDRTRRAPAGKQIVQMLLDGELDAILGEKVDHPDLKPLFADVKGEEARWFARHGVKPINHMVVVKQELSERHPAVVREVHRLLIAAAAVDKSRFAAADMRRSLGCITAYSAQQNLIARPFAVDELFDDVTRALIQKDH
jgi:4,5-dihydroxyphthalate decarboxylase